jgi:3-deoxy-D-manno-octulosonic-acid transferase/heptosyltransferase-1
MKTTGCLKGDKFAIGSGANISILARNHYFRPICDYGLDMNILIVKLSAIGDVIHTLPAVNAIRRQYPHAHISWLIEEDAADLILGHSALNRVMISKRKKWLKGLRGANWRENLKHIVDFIQTLRDTHYDLVIDFQFLLKSGVLIGLTRADRKIGFDRGMEHMEHSYLFLNERVPPVDMEVHALERNLMLIRHLDVDCQRVEYNLPIRPYHFQLLRDDLNLQGYNPSQPLVAMNPVAKWETKLWSAPKFAQLADRLIQTYGVSVVFTGSPQDVAQTAAIASLMKNPAIDMAGKTTLKSLAALYQKTVMLITTDTGPMHLAAAVNTPTVALFGPTAPWRTGPYGNRHTVVRQPVACSPCFKRQCQIKTHECMCQLSVEQVFGTVQKRLKKILVGNTDKT